MQYRPRFRLKKYRGYYYRFNNQRNRYEIGKYIEGKWTMLWATETEDQAKDDIDKDIRRIEGK